MQATQNGKGHDLPSNEVPLPGERRATGTKYDNARVHTDEDDDEGDDGWQLDDLQDETYELMPQGGANGTRSRSAPLSDLSEEAGLQGKNDINSALAMVKAVVSEDDDPSLPTLTFRVIVLGSVLCAIGAAVSQLFFVGAISLPALRPLTLCYIVQIQVSFPRRLAGIYRSSEGQRPVLLGFPDHPTFIPSWPLDGSSPTEALFLLLGSCIHPESRTFQRQGACFGISTCWLRLWSSLRSRHHRNHGSLLSSDNRSSRRDSPSTIDTNARLWTVRTHVQSARPAKQDGLARMSRSHLTFQHSAW